MLDRHTLALPEPGEVLAGKYRIVRKLGEGGMGVVYEAVHTRIHQRVAIKMLLPEVLELPDVVSRFEREARAAGKLKSENSARVLDVDVSEAGMPYMVMEFLEGSDLGKIVEGGALPIATAVDYVLQACNAMAEAHAEGVIHRDLKPSNLFVTAGAKLKVLDFGISKLENDSEARVTATQTVVGTPLYMSPEQVRSAKDVDARGDIWSLGIILYELLTGRTPFEGSTTAAAVAICIDAPPPISKFREGVPAELERAILTALQKDPAARFSTVQALANSIVAFGTGAIKAPIGPGVVPFAVRSQPSLPGLAQSDPSYPTATPNAALRGAASATSPGWSTRSETGKRRSRWLFASIAVGGVFFALLGVGFFVNRMRQAPAATASVPNEILVTSRPLESATPHDVGVVLTASASASVSSIAAVPSTPTHTASPQGKPHATATATITATATHMSPAPTPTRL